MKPALGISYTVNALIAETDYFVISTWMPKAYLWLSISKNKIIPRLPTPDIVSTVFLFLVQKTPITTVAQVRKSQRLVTISKSSFSYTPFKSTLSAFCLPTQLLI